MLCGVPVLDEVLLGCTRHSVLARSWGGGDLLVQAELRGHLLPGTKIPDRGGWRSPWKSELSF